MFWDQQTDNEPGVVWKHISKLHVLQFVSDYKQVLFNVFIF